MQLTRTQEAGVTILAVTGTVKLGESAQHFAAELQDIFDTTPGGVLLDLSQIDHLDSTGIGELVGYLQKFGQAKRRIALFRPHKRVESLLKLTRLDAVFSTFTEKDEALRFLSGKE